MATKENKDKKLAIKLVAGVAGSTQRQRKTLEALGLGRRNSVVYHDASPTILGMLDKVKHMLEVTDNK